MNIETQSSQAKVVALCGYAGAGKDAFADALCELHGYTKIGFADKLYELALKLDPVIWSWPWPRKLSRIVKSKGWTAAKRIPRIRRYLQWLGTEVCRELFGEDFWIEQTKPVISQLVRDNKNVVITNCRFENEAQFIEEIGGCIVLVQRPGVGPVNEHVSDQGKAFDYAIFRVANDGTLQDLQEWANACDAAMHGVHPNPIVNLTPFEAAIQRAIACGVELVLDVAAPASIEAEKWRKRHRLELMKIDQEIRVLVDGEEAGKVRYADNIVEVDAKIAR